MSNPKRPDFSGIPRLTEQLDGEELTAHFAVPPELLEQLRDDDDATRVQTMPVGLLEHDESVHTSPTLPPPAPQSAPVPSVAQPSSPVVRAAFPPATEAELQSELRAMRQPQRFALVWGLLIVVALVLFTWRLLSD